VGIDECRLIELPSVEDPQGNLVFAEGERHVPFAIARAYHVYGVPAGAKRGGHAHREVEQMVICIRGGFELAVDDGSQRRTLSLDDPRSGLYLPPWIWHDLTDFAADSAYYVVSSGLYDETEYVRDYEEFQRLASDPSRNP
jgi:dTDP-4-dehydrorhamnose 3,5-epimerase-like enzyme